MSLNKKDRQAGRDQSNHEGPEKQKKADCERDFPEKIKYQHYNGGHDGIGYKVDQGYEERQIQ